MVPPWCPFAAAVIFINLFDRGEVRNLGKSASWQIKGKRVSFIYILILKALKKPFILKLGRNLKSARGCHPVVRIVGVGT